MRDFLLSLAVTFLTGVAMSNMACAAAATTATTTTNAIGSSCKVLGTTQMSDDKTGLIGCFLVTGTTGAAPSCTNSAGVANGNCVWKSTTSTSATAVQGSLCGMYWDNTNESGVSNSTLDMHCLGKSVVTGCPSGYTQVTTTNGYAGAIGFTCAKN